MAPPVSYPCLIIPPLNFILYIHLPCEWS